jgi:hypothetical protein
MGIASIGPIMATSITAQLNAALPIKWIDAFLRCPDEITAADATGAQQESPGAEAPEPYTIPAQAISVKK